MKKLTIEQQLSNIYNELLEIHRLLSQERGINEPCYVPLPWWYHQGPNDWPYGRWMYTYTDRTTINTPDPTNDYLYEAGKSWNMK